MSNVLLTWNLPTVSKRQAPLKHTRVEFRVSQSAPWTAQDTVPADGPQEFRFMDVDAGTTYYRVIVVDTVGQEGQPVETSADVPLEPPGVVTNLTATVEG